MKSNKKSNLYRLAAGQVRSKVKNHLDLIATLSNTMAILKERFPNFFWVGIYFLKNRHLILGPFQGPPACMKLSLETGVCATAVTQKRSIIIPDVNQFPGHVSCDNRSRSEIVVPLFDEEQSMKAVLDVDSENLNDFDSIDLSELERIGKILCPVWK